MIRVLTVIVLCGVCGLTGGAASAQAPDGAVASGRTTVFERETQIVTTAPDAGHFLEVTKFLTGLMLGSRPLKDKAQENGAEARLSLHQACREDANPSGYGPFDVDAVYATIEALVDQSDQALSVPESSQGYDFAVCPKLTVEENNQERYEMYTYKMSLIDPAGEEVWSFSRYDIYNK